MRILLLVRSLGIGGTERQVVLLAKGLHELGHQVHLASFYGDGSLHGDLHNSGVVVHALKKSGTWDAVSFFWRTARLVRSLQPTIIYSFLSTPNLLAIPLKLVFPRVRIVWGIRASYVDWRSYRWVAGFAYHLERLLSRFADHIVCNSRAGLEHAASAGFPRSRMTVIPNGINLARYAPDRAARAAIRREWGLERDVIAIGLVGRIDPIKDHSTFLRAAALLSKLRSDVRFICVGDGEDLYVARLRAQADELGIAGRVIWTGRRMDMPAVYNALDVNCLCSVGEGFSNTIVEAMASGVPCVVTDVGDSAWIVGTLGEVVPRQDADALAEGLRRMVVRLSPQLSEAIRRSIADRLGHDTLVSETVKVLSALK